MPVPTTHNPDRYLLSVARYHASCTASYSDAASDSSLPWDERRDHARSAHYHRERRDSALRVLLATPDPEPDSRSRAPSPGAVTSHPPLPIAVPTRRPAPRSHPLAQAPLESASDPARPVDLAWPATGDPTMARNVAVPGEGDTG
jgi:hypothetical protein